MQTASSGDLRLMIRIALTAEQAAGQWELMRALQQPLGFTSQSRSAVRGKELQFGALGSGPMRFFLGREPEAR